MTPQIDNWAEFDTVMLEKPGSLSSTTTSDPADLANYNSATALWILAEVTQLNASNFWTLTLTESDVVGSGYTTVVAADIIDGTTSPTASILVDSTAEDSKIYKLGYKGNKRFIKAVLTETGTVTGTHCLVIILGDKRMGPMSATSNAIAS